MTDAKHHSPATTRNREAIRGVLARVLPAQGTVLEIASGSGEHVVFFADKFPHLSWQPSDISNSAIASTAAWRRDAKLANVLAPIVLDVTAPAWPVSNIDAILCINMLHIAPWDAAVALFVGASRVLAPGALLYLYGPYKFAGTHTSASNAAFDAELRSDDPSWGVRDYEAVAAAGQANGFVLTETLAMPTNNHSLIFHRGP
jgi:SAM-dependent methyltransferase